MRPHYLIVLLTLFTSPATVAAQTPQGIVACANQQALEQMLASDGQFMPDECRNIAINSLETEHGRICVMDFQADEDPGLIGQITDAALPTQWWVPCEDLATID